MAIWLISAALFAAWLVGKFVFGKGGFIHILLLCAVATAVVQYVHERRAARQ
ncbi:MAG TPA: lmo0937 family membrane protein [Pyrinomonadaceae bacterium]|nr:lmo0937 family membrane protein [Pyrinomonadaceae bacterium]